MGPVARLCSKNRGKLRELRAALPDWQIELLGAEDYPLEEGDTYYENARAKARFGRSIAPDVWVIGEDSGIEVDGLDGRPGVHSARFGADDPVGRLLAEMADVADRSARYVCELVVLSPKGEEHRGTGALGGSIAHEPRGSEGFGYDPIFVPDGENRTVAELGNEWKRTNSHRARAAEALRRTIQRKDYVERVELWTGLVHVRALPDSELDPGDGAFVHVVAPAQNASTFEAAARSALAAKGFEYLSASRVEAIERRLAIVGVLLEIALEAAATGKTAIGSPHVYSADAEDADVDYTVEERLRDAEREEVLVDVVRVEDFHNVRGFVVDVGNDLVVIHRMAHQITLDGYSIVRLRDVIDVVSLEESHFASRALTLLGMTPAKPSIIVTNLESVFLTLADGQEVATIACERVDSDVFNVGEIQRVETDGVLLRRISTNAKWQDIEFYEFREITRVNFGGRYEAALLMVARESEQQSDD